MPHPRIINCFAVITICGFGSTYHWVAWPLMVVLVCLIVGHSPFWIVAAIGTWCEGRRLWIQMAVRGGIRIASRTAPGCQITAELSAYRELAPERPKRKLPERPPKPELVMIDEPRQLASGGVR